MKETLKKILGEEILICTTLVELAIEKREFIINNDAEKLTNNIVKAEQYVNKIYKLKETKDKIMHINGIKTLKEYAENLNKTEKAHIEDLLEQKKEVISALKKEEKLNQRLVENQLEVVKMMLNIIKPKEVIHTYDRRGVSGKSGNVIGINFRG